MNLNDWLSYRSNCPLCDCPLTTFLHSKRRQSVKYEEGRLVVIFPRNNLYKKRSHPELNIAYSFDLYTNSFCIEFYDKDNIRLENWFDNSLMERFKILNKNLGKYRFYRQCESCQRFNYSSNDFSLSLETALLSKEITVATEFFQFIQTLDTTKGKLPFRIYRLLNCYGPRQSLKIGSYLSYWDDLYPNGNTLIQYPHPKAQNIDLPLIPFVGPEETLARIQKLLIFS